MHCMTRPNYECFEDKRSTRFPLSKKYNQKEYLDGIVSRAEARYFQAVTLGEDVAERVYRRALLPEFRENNRRIAYLNRHIKKAERSDPLTYMDYHRLVLRRIKDANKKLEKIVKESKPKSYQIAA